MSASKFSKSPTSEPAPEPVRDVDDEAPVMARVAPLTGRDTEVGLLMDRWEQANEGMGQVVLLIGEAGLGKSRLVRTLKEHVLGQMVEGEVDSPVIEWRCSPHFQDTGLHPAIDFYERALDFGLGEPAQARFDRLLSRLDAYDLARPETVPLWASLLGLPTPDRFPPLPLSPTRQREETFRFMLEWLHTRAVRRPVLFVVEDLHWVDASTLEFLGQFLAEGLHDRILTLLTFRPEFKTPWPAVAHQTSLALNRLTRRQVGDLMRRIAGSGVPDPLVEQIYARTGGVPLLVEEFAKLAQEPDLRDRAGHAGTGTQAPLGREMPATLQALVMARLDRMTSNREVAQLAATIGREFAYETLAAVATVGEATLQAELAKLVRAEIVHERGRPPACTYTFKHALLEDALRDALAEGERQQFHRRIGEALEAQFLETVRTKPELLALHFTEANLPEKAVRYWLKAGLRSRERSAEVEAIGHLTKGLELVATLDESRERDARELELLRALGSACMASRGYAAAGVGSIFARARELSDRVGQPVQVFATMYGSWAFHFVRGDLRRCTELATEALEFAGQHGDPEMLTEALKMRGQTMLYRADLSRAHETLAMAVHKYDDPVRTKNWVAYTSQDPAVANRCHLAISLWHLGFPDQALQTNRDMLQLAHTMSHPFTLAYALHHASWLKLGFRLGTELTTTADEQIDITTEQGFPMWQASGIFFKGAGLMQQGRVQDAIPLMLNGLHAFQATGAELMLTYQFSALGDAYIRAGRFEEARRALDEGLAIAAKNDERCQEAELRRLQGELLLAESPRESAAAEGCFREAIATARGQQSRSWELRATTSLARLWHKLGRGKEARAALSAVYGTYTEGFATPDLLDAKALLEILENEHMREDFASGVKYVLDSIPPPIDGPVSIDWRYIPSSSLGGDTIGYHWIDDDHLALYLIDVTGHGLDAALLSVTIANVLRSGSLMGADMRRPDQVLGTLNDAFPGEQHGQKLFTAWYGVYERSAGLLTWSGGGHHPSILLPPGARDPILLPSSGMMMGVMSGLEYRAESCEVAADARLIIFSDGIFEIIRDGRVVWDLDACIAYLGTARSRGGALMDELLAHVRVLRGSHELADDFSILEACFRNVTT